MCMVHPVVRAFSLFLPWTWLPPRVHVSATRIYARHERTRQSVVYDLRLRSRTEAVMVLPVPVRVGASETALRFVDASADPKMLDRLDLIFEEWDRPAPPRGGLGLYRVPERPKLAVHRVGAFDASFVPTLRDFDRLDARLRFDDTVWAALPSYADYGFAVFRLRPGDARIQPMAFWFETRDPDRVFFPTVHVHDGKVRDVARFDHALYFQVGGPQRGIHARAQGLYDPEGTRAIPELVGPERIFRETRRGRLPNEDVWIALD